MEIRLLREADDRSTFSSGDDELDRFFHQYAGQNQFKHHIGTTYVATEGTRVLGYVTVAPAQMDVEHVPRKRRAGLPQYPVPVLRLARLARDKSVTGQGVGEALLFHALRLALRMAREYGCYGVLVDAKEGRVSYYAKYDFEVIRLEEGESGTRPRPTPMFLPLKLIIAAVERSLPSLPDE